MPDAPTGTVFRDFLTISEVMAEGLPGMPSSRSAIRRCIQKCEGFDWRRTANPRGISYEFRALPLGAISAYVRKHRAAFEASVGCGHLRSSYGEKQVLREAEGGALAEILIDRVEANPRVW